MTAEIGRLQQNSGAELLGGDLGGGGTSQTSSALWLTRRQARALALIGVATYLGGMVVTLPASTALRLGGDPDWGLASGAVWNGSRLLQDGTKASWRLSPLASLFSLSAVGRLRLEGPATAASARFAARPGRIELIELNGRVGPSLLGLFSASLPIRCETSIMLGLSRLVLGGRGSGAAGDIWTEPGVCAAPGGRSAAIPALHGAAMTDRAGSTLVLSPVGRPSEPVAQFQWPTTGPARLTLLAAGTALFAPGAPAGSMILELPGPVTDPPAR